MQVPTTPQDTLEELNWDIVETSQLLDQAQEFTRSYDDMVSCLEPSNPNIREVVTRQKRNQPALRGYTSNVVKKKRQPAATHVLLVMLNTLYMSSRGSELRQLFETKPRNPGFLSYFHQTMEPVLDENGWSNNNCESIYHVLWDDAAQCFNELEYSNLAPETEDPGSFPCKNETVSDSEYTSTLTEVHMEGVTDFLCLWDADDHYGGYHHDKSGLHPPDPTHDYKGEVLACFEDGPVRVVVCTTA
ncbi:hypothetical protein Bbelb_047990 [Branchiostoma belcheri]|nr:hypothetical protein Bbelb_047990 [Branchiostoma belcheri]